MAGVDNRIVTMQFNNAQFEQNAKTSLSTLQKLKESMNFGSIVGGTVKGLGAIDGALSKIGLKTPFAPMIRAANAGLSGIGTVLDKVGIRNPFANSTKGAADLQSAAANAGGPAGMGVLEGGVTAVSGKFIALTTVAVAALTNITNKAINSGTAFLKSFTFAPVMDGLREYELNLKSIQTVQANTDQPLPKINGALDELNKYADQTIYNFAEMAKNVGTFTAAGVDLDTSVSSIKGIANLAALSGSNSQQAATAMYQLSQAIAAGKVGLMDWNSVVNAGMGGKKLQNALAQTAVAMGELDKSSVKTVGTMKKLEINGSSFRESIMAQPGQESWLSSEALVNTLSVMDGRFSEAALAAEKTEMGLQKYSDAQIRAKIETARTNLEQKNGVKYTEEQFKALAKMSTMAFKSATEVKTLGQVFDIAKESIASGWSASFRNIFGGLKEAKTLFTGMSTGLNSLIEQNALARNTLLNAWKEGGGRLTVIEGFKNAWEAVLGILGPIREGFRDIFPAKTADDLISMSNAFEQFTANLIPGADTMENLRTISAGVFSIFSILGQVLGGVITGIKTLFGAVGDGNGSFLDLLANVASMITAFDSFLKQSGILTTFFSGLGGILSVPVALLQGLASAISSIFEGFNIGRAEAVGDSIEDTGNKLSGVASAADAIQGFFSGITDMLSNFGSMLGSAIVGIGEMLGNLVTSDAFGPTLDAINTGLFAAITAMIVKFFKDGPSVDVTGGFLSNVTGVLEEVTGTLSALQTSLKADALLKIGGAVAILAAAIYVLSTIDSGDLTKALTAIGAGFAVLMGTMVAMMKFMGPVSIAQVFVLSTAMTALATAMLILAGALKVMASINFGDTARGLLALGGMLYIINKAMQPLAANHKGMIRAAGSLILLGVAINILAVALKIFATMSWEEMIKGLAGLTGTLLALSIGMKAMPPMNTEAVTLIALAFAINLLAIALKVFATMSWQEMAKGLTGLAGALVAIGLAMRIMPKGMLLQAAALNAVATAMVVLSGALKILSKMSWKEMAKGLAGLAGSLAILAIGLRLMKGTLMGAAALVVAAAALAIFTPVLAALGNLSIATIVTGLLAIAGVFTVLGVAGYLLAPVVPVIIGLSAALLLLGAGLALAGAGAMAAATAFAIVVAAGTAGAVVMTQMLAAIITAIPPAMAAFGKGVVQFAVAIGQGAPKIAAAFGRILLNLINQVIRVTPRLGRMFLTMLNTAIRVVVTAAPRIANAGLRLITSFLDAVSRHIPRIVQLAADIIVKFLNGISRNIGRIIDSGVKLILAFVRGVASAIRENSEELGEAGADLGLAMVEGLADAIRGAAGRIKDAAMDAARAAWEAVKDFFKVKSPSRLMRDTVGKPIVQGWVKGIHDEAPAVGDELVSVGKSAIDALDKTMSYMGDALSMDPNFNPTIAPVLDLTKLTQEANKMSDILATAPIMPTMSYQTANAISSMTQSSNDDDGSGQNGGSSGGDTYYNYEHHLHSPTPLDHVSIYRDGKSLISLKKGELV